MSRINFPFRGVYISAAIWLNPALSWGDRIAYAFIDLTEGEPIDHDTLGRLMGVNCIEAGVHAANLVKAGLIVEEGGILTKTGVTHNPREAEPKPSMIEGFVEEVIAMYHGYCSTMCRVQKITQQRKEAIRSLAGRRMDFDILFRTAGQSDFLTGRNGQKWVADFDWIVKPVNAQRIIEGRYGNNRATGMPIRLSENLRG